jgi:integrase
MAKRRGNGEGSIYQRKDGRWCGQATVDTDPATGKPVRETVYAATYEEVRDKLREALEKARTLAAESRDMNVRGFLDFWFESRKPRPAGHTIRHYTLVLGKARPLLTGRLRELTAFDMTRMYQRLEADGASTNCRKWCGKLPRLAPGDAVKMGFIERNPAAVIPLPRHVSKEMRPLDPAEVRRFLDAVQGDRLEALYFVALDTGARPGELFGLRWSDWDEARGTLTIGRTLQELARKLSLKEPKTKAGRRTVVPGQAARTALAAHRRRMLAERHGDCPVFCDGNGGHLRNGNLHTHSFKPALKKAGLPPIRFHDLRHTCATLMLLAGENVLTVADRLGHAKPHLVMDRYGLVLPEGRARAAAALDRYLLGT